MRPAETELAEVRARRKGAASVVERMACMMRIILWCCGDASWEMVRSGSEARGIEQGRGLYMRLDSEECLMWLVNCKQCAQHEATDTLM